jgi:lysophospholipase L1-like esterase
MEWILIGLFGLLLVVWVMIRIFRSTFDRGVRKGADDFLKLLLKSGFDQKVASFKEQNRHVKQGGIAFVGDSITQDFPIHDYLSGMLVYNRGIGGDTTLGLITRLNESIYELRPHTVILLIGTNDFALLNAKPEQVRDNIAKIVFEIKTVLPNTRIVLESIYPVNPSLDRFSVGDRSNRTIFETNQLLMNLPDVTYVDLYAVLSNELGELKPEYTVEGLHINHNGYALIAKTLKPYLTKPEMD